MSANRCAHLAAVTAAKHAKRREHNDCKDRRRLVVLHANEALAEYRNKRRSPLAKKRIDAKPAGKVSAQPHFRQHVREIQPYRAVSHLLPLELEEPVRLEMAEQLNQLFADSIILRELYKKIPLAGGWWDF